MAAGRHIDKRKKLWKKHQFKHGLAQMSKAAKQLDDLLFARRQDQSLGSQPMCLVKSQETNL
jgi:hypothetical protein